MTLRDELGQLAWVGKRHASLAQLRRQWGVTRTTDLPDLPKRKRRLGEIWGVSMVRDEADVIMPVINHLLAQGIDHILVADNNSVDGTLDLLRELSARDPRVHVALDREPSYIQSEKITWLANRAWRAGADWIVPFDADEFWFGMHGSVAETLRAQRVGIVHAKFHHMVPTEAHPSDLLDAEFVMDATSIFPGKVAIRSHPLAWIGPGNHSAARVGGETTALAIAHAIYRGPQQIARKVRQGAQAAGRIAHVPDWFAPHWVAGAKLDDAAILEAWEAARSGLPVDDIGLPAKGPMVHVRPLRWSVWDPDGVISPAQGVE